MSTRFSSAVKWCAALLAVSAMATSAYAHSDHDGSAEEVETKHVADAAEAERARAYFSDTILKTHYGRDVRFYSDMMDGYTVVISFIFTNCEDACPLINNKLEMIQSEIGSRMGEDIRFISITVDPKNDSAEVLADYRERFNASPAWVFLTGEPENIDFVSERLGQVFERESHLTALLVGNTRTARWRKLPSYFPHTVLAAQITDIADEQ